MTPKNRARLERLERQLTPPVPAVSVWDIISCAATVDELPPAVRAEFERVWAAACDRAERQMREMGYPTPDEDRR